MAIGAGGLQPTGLGHFQAKGRSLLAGDFRDGSDVTNVELPGFPGGLFVAMSTDKTFHFYAWDDIAQAAGLE